MIGFTKAQKNFSAEFTLSEVEWARNDKCSHGAVVLISKNGEIFPPG
jgi:hypothetical protein